MIGHAAGIIDALGFFPVKMDMPILSQMQTYSQATLMMGIIFDVVVLLFIVLSVLLIYSLLMISVESKTFEFGVMRMMGLSNTGIITMIVMQGFMFVIPSVIAGFILSAPSLQYVYDNLLSNDLELDLTPVPSPSAIMQALIIGTVIPIVSSVAPIQSAMK